VIPAHQVRFYLPVMSDDYEIRVQGHLDARWASWFDGLTLAQDPDGTTVMRGRVADQAALHGLIQKVRDMGLPLVSVTTVNTTASIPSKEPRP